jgi:hypothetical protein
MKGLLAMLLATSCLAACGGGGSGMGPEPGPATPAQTAKVDFTAFTKELLRAQSDSAQPSPVTTAQFEFADNDNALAFAAVLPAT